MQSLKFIITFQKIICYIVEAPTTVLLVPYIGLPTSRSVYNQTVSFSPNSGPRRVYGAATMFCLITPFKCFRNTWIITSLLFLANHKWLDPNICNCFKIGFYFCKKTYNTNLSMFPWWSYLIFSWPIEHVNPSVPNELGLIILMFVDLKCSKMLIWCDGGYVLIQKYWIKSEYLQMLWKIVLNNFLALIMSRSTSPWLWTFFLR